MRRKYRDGAGRIATPDPMQYFLANVRKNETSGCWNWVGNMFSNGYGQFKNKRVNGGVPLAASRAAWLLFKGGPLGRHEFICHKCDNRQCANPEHLFLGTNQSNMVDAVQKRRISHGEDRPQSKLTEADVVEARRLRQGGMGWLALAKRYGVAQYCIISAVTGKTWSHVKEPVPTYVGKAGRRPRRIQVA